MLEEQGAVTPEKASQILGCAPEQVRDYVQGWPLASGRWRFRLADVIAERDKRIRAAAEMKRRNSRMVRRAASK